MFERTTVVTQPDAIDYLSTNCEVMALKPKTCVYWMGVENLCSPPYYQCIQNQIPCDKDRTRLGKIELHCSNQFTLTEGWWDGCSVTLDIYITELSLFSFFFFSLNKRRICANDRYSPNLHNSSQSSSIHSQSLQIFAKLTQLFTVIFHTQSIIAKCWIL